MSCDRAPWVIVAGGFHQHGGMDRANAALAAFLLGRGTPVHLIAHDVDPALAGHPLATVHHVRRPARLPGVAEALLSREGLAVAGKVVAAVPEARVVVNGGNCPWPDINWVHAVHAAWPVRDHGAPWWSRCRNRLLKRAARRRERVALAVAQMVVANSQGTCRALEERLEVAAWRLRRVYLGSDPAWGVADAAERRDARRALGLRPDTPVVAFVGALGGDVNKGFDLLWDAWKSLAVERTWDASLVVAGGGWRVARWTTEARRSAELSSVQFLGFTPRIRQVLAAADLLVSPVRYEAYGLNVHEALCCGVPVMVTSSAGVVECFENGMADALLPVGIGCAELAARLRSWRGDLAGWRERAAPTAARLRARTWNDMAADFVAGVETAPRSTPA